MKFVKDYRKGAKSAEKRKGVRRKDIIAYDLN